MKHRIYDLSDPDAVAFCPLCGAGYTARATRCADCQRELWPRWRVEAILERGSDSTNRELGEDTMITIDALANVDLSNPKAMWFCPTCGAGETGPGYCNDCDKRLLPRVWVEQQAKQKRRQGESVRLCRMAGFIEAGRLEVELSEADIPYSTRVLGATGTGLDGLRAGVDFFVLADDLERSRAVLSRVEELSASDGGEDSTGPNDV